MLDQGVRELTVQDLAVLELIYQGVRNAEIAGRLGRILHECVRDIDECAP